MTVTTWGEEYAKGGYEGLLSACKGNFAFYMAMDNPPDEVAEYLATEAANDCQAQGLLEGGAEAAGDAACDELFDRLLKDLNGWAGEELHWLQAKAREAREALERPLARAPEAGIRAIGGTRP
jgi:hypothetical protein